MESLFTYVAPPSTCSYLPEQLWSLEYEYVGDITAEEYEQRLEAGWRHFGRMLFRPACRSCSACRSLRIPARTFIPDRSQRRAWKANQDIRLEIGDPSPARVKLRLYDHFHAFQSENKGWPLHPAKDVESYADSFTRNPFNVQEWCYYLDRQLVGVGYVDDLPHSHSAIYFFYDPDQRDRSLGTFNVLNILDRAAQTGKQFVYLGYHVAGCRSMEYKARFRPNQTLGLDGQWHSFLE
jgi:arginine-tRNA-protein transferase